MKDKKYYGIVEGFFSSPLKMWTWKERNKTFDFIREYAPSINAYLYCPKDDLLVTKKPYELYSQKEISAFQKFVDKCNENEVTFIFGLNPSFAEKELANISLLKKKILKKLNQFIRIGVRDVCLLFDDIPIAYDVFEESATFSEETSTKIIELVNSVYAELEYDLDSFWFCSPDYNFTKETNLTKAIGNLNKDINIFWTGNEIFSKEKDAEDLNRAKKISGSNNIVIWDNYPVNDAEQNVGCFNLNGFYLIETKVLNDCKGIFVNPMREAFANLPFYITFSKYVESKDSYLRKKSWRRSLSKIGLKDELVLLVEQFSVPNAFDTPMLDVNMSLEKIDKVLKPSTPTNDYGQLFLAAINQVIEDAKSCSTIFKKLEKKEELTVEYFTSLDLFPTKTNVARYYPEVLKIICERYRLYSEINLKTELKKYFKLSEYFEKTYKGKDRLKISNYDNDRILKSIIDLILVEQKKFIEFLNNNNTSLINKRKLYLKRKNVNRFTIE